MPTCLCVMIWGTTADLNRHLFGPTQLVSSNRADNSGNQSVKKSLWFNYIKIISYISYIADLIYWAMPLDWFIGLATAVYGNAF